jgi:hypothetical protein
MLMVSKGTSLERWLAGGVDGVFPDMPDHLTSEAVRSEWRRA